MDGCSRAARLIVMIGLLSDRSYSAKELATELGVSVRTIYIDLAELQDEPLRVALMVSSGRWYRLRLK